MKLIKRITSIFAVCYLTFAILGCGYTTRSMISMKYKTIYITPFVNKIDFTRDTDVGSKYKIYRPRLDTDVTKTVNNKFLFDGNLKPTKMAKADLTLKGELVDFVKDPLRYDDSDNVSEYRINIRVNLILWDNKENKLVWEEKSFTGEVTYLTSGTGAKTEAQAVNDAIDDLARRIIERAVEDW